MTQRWKVPKSCSDERVRSLCIEVDDELVLDLSKQENRDFLFKEFRKIRTRQDAEKWLTNIGSLYPQIGMKDFVKLSKTVQWVHKFFEALREENTRFLRGHLLHMSKLDRATSSFTEEEFRELEQRVLTAWEENTNTESSDLVNYLSVVLAADRPERIFAIFGPKEDFGIGLELPYIGGVRGGRSLDSPHVCELWTHDLEEEFENRSVLDDDIVLKSFAYRYLERVLSSLSANLRVAVRLHQAPDGYSYFEQGFDCEYPWEAIVSELVKLVSGSVPPKRCENRGCGVLFTPNKSHQRFCGRPGCRKAVNRQRKQQEAKQNS